MSCLISILLVEDEKSNIELWSDSVKTFNSNSDENGFEIVYDNVESVVNAKSYCSMRRYDAVIVDLRLKPSDGVVSPNDDGNALIHYLIATSAVGIVVYTGQENEFDISTCPQVKVFSKANGLGPVFDWIKNERPLFDSLRGARDTIEREVAKVFFSAIWPRWKSWTSSETNDVKLREAMARHVVAHVHDVLLSNVETAHFEESYFVPPVKDKLDTGDMVYFDNELWIVVTPRCDLAKSDGTVSLLFSRCKDMSSCWSNLSDAGSKTSKSKMSDIQQHEKSLRQHFLPPMLKDEASKAGPWLVQFDDLKVVPISKRNELVSQRMASLTPQFVPSLVERFGAYFSRIGTPALSG